MLLCRLTAGDGSAAESSAVEGKGRERHGFAIMTTVIGEGLGARLLSY